MRTKLVAIVSFVVFGAIIAVVSYFIVQSNKEPVVTFSETTMHIGGTGGSEVPMASIVDLQLVDSIPEVTRKIDGYDTFGVTKKGLFELDGLGPGRLYLVSGSGPYLFAQTKDDYVVINFEQPATTKALFDELSAKLPAP